MKAKDFDTAFDSGEDVTQFLVLGPGIQTSWRSQAVSDQSADCSAS